MLSLIKKDKVLAYDITLPYFEELHKNYNIVIHIGAPKTGSSAIQKFLLENRIKLKKSGLYYPEHGLDENGISGGHSNLGLALSKNLIAEAKAILETYLSEAKDENLTLLISAEALFNYPEKLKQITKGYRCKIISFFRDPVDSIDSNYNQGVKRHFATNTIRGYYENILKNNSRSISGEIFEKWSEHYGKENLIILGYDPVVLEQLTIQELFLNVLGIEKAIIEYLKPKNTVFINKSYTPAALELKRILNFVLDQECTNQNNQIDWFLQHLSDTQKEKVYTMDSSTKKRVEEKFLQSNKLIKQKYILEINPGFLDKNIIQEEHILSYSEILKGILNILHQMQIEKVDLYQYIIRRTEETLQTKNTIFDVSCLAKWLSIQDVETYEDNYWFNDNQINRMAEGKYKDVDFLRDIATILKNKKDYINSEKILKHALILRPNGPVLIKLNKSLQKCLKEINYK